MCSTQASVKKIKHRYPPEECYDFSYLCQPEGQNRENFTNTSIMNKILMLFRLTFVSPSWFSDYFVHHNHQHHHQQHIHHYNHWCWFTMKCKIFLYLFNMKCIMMLKGTISNHFHSITLPEFTDLLQAKLVYNIDTNNYVLFKMWGDINYSFPKLQRLYWTSLGIDK